MSEKVLGMRNEGKVLLQLFRAQQNNHGNIGCVCHQCVQDMANALNEFNKRSMTNALNEFNKSRKKEEKRKKEDGEKKNE